MKVDLPKILQPFGCDDIIRVGKNNDGGYLVNEKDVINTSELISFGVGSDISFERHFTSINDCSVTAYDGTITDNQSDFFANNNRFINENIENTKKIETILQDKHGVFINCDIDGWEYNILNEFIIQSKKITGLCIEFHGLTEYKNFNNLTNFISKFGLNLIHTHINNYSYRHIDNTIIPDVIELTFSSSENVYLDPFISLPHHLDMPNNPEGIVFETIF